MRLWLWLLLCPLYLPAQEVSLRPATDDERRAGFQVFMDYVSAERVVAGQDTSIEEALDTSTTDCFSQHEMRLILANDQVVGMLIWNRVTSQLCYLTFLYLSDSKRSQGIGSQSMELWETALRAEGVKVILLHVFPQNVRARHFYLNRGFQPIESMDEFLEKSLP